MERYIGIDAHLKSCTLAVMGPSGRRLHELVVETHGRALRDSLTAVAGSKQVCLEEGELSEWLYELLTPLASKVVVVQPQRRVGTKSDAADAWELADLLRRQGVHNAVYKAPGQFTGLREAVRAHQATVRDVVRAKNRLRAVYRARGVAVSGRGIYRTEQRDAWLKKLPAARRRLAELLSAQLDALATVAQEAESWLLEEAGRYPIVRLLATAPGIGQVRSSQIVATVISPHRFRTKRQFWSYCGLAVVTRSSSDWELDREGKRVRRKLALPRGLNRNRNPVLKEVFKGAAATIISLMPEHPLALNYQRLVRAGTKASLARVTIARQLAAAVLAMWKHQEGYDPQRHMVQGAA